MKEAIRTCAPQFSMRRMVKDYTNQYYVPAIEQSLHIADNNYGDVRKLATWKERVRKAWPSLELYVDGKRDGQLSLGEGIDVHAWVRANGLSPEDLCVELVYGETKEDQVEGQHALTMQYTKLEQDGSYRYDVRLQPDESGSLAYNVRIVPTHSKLSEKYEMNLIRWG
jgi:starch phosphorylase